MTAITGKKLVFVTESLTHGGAERVLVSLVNELKQRGFSVDLVLLTTEGFPDFYRVSEDIKVYRLEEMHPALAWIRKFWFLGFCLHLLMKILFLRKLLREIRGVNQESILISFMTPPNVLSRMASLGMAYKTILCERVYPGYESGWLARLGRFLFYRFADVILVQTKSMGEWFGKSMASKVFVIANPLSEFPAQESAQREKLVLGVGRLSKQKRFDLLIRAFAQVSSQMPNWKLEILGEGAERSNLTNLIHELNMNSRIVLSGVQRDVWKFYDRCGVFVLSSDYEGFPNVLLEAMSRGAACVATDCLSGPSDLIENEKSGFLVPACDQNALEKSLLRLMGDSAQRERLGNAAKTESLKYSMANILENWISIFNKL